MPEHINSMRGQTRFLRPQNYSQRRKGSRGMEERIHNIIIEERARVSVSAVSEVLTFDENEVILKVKGATLTIKGNGMHVEELSMETGDARISATSVESIIYSKIDRERSKEGFFGRLLK